MASRKRPIVMLRARTRRTKYGNTRCEVDGLTFDSKKEARRWQELKLLEKAGEIHSLGRQIIYPLVVNGKVIGRLVADFRYWDLRIKKWVTEDTKGHVTPLWRWKAKHFEAQTGRKILET